MSTQPAARRHEPHEQGQQRQQRERRDQRQRPAVRPPNAVRRDDKRTEPEPAVIDSPHRRSAGLDGLVPG